MSDFEFISACYYKTIAYIMETVGKANNSINQELEVFQTSLAGAQSSALFDDCVLQWNQHSQVWCMLDWCYLNSGKMCLAANTRQLCICSR